MLKYRRFNEDGFLGLTLTHLGLMIASILLVAAISSIMNDDIWEQNKMEQISEYIVDKLSIIDDSWVEQQLTVSSSSFDSRYHIYLSQQSILIKSKEDDQIMYREPLFIQPWIRNSTQEWKNASDFHQYLKTNFGKTGHRDDPIAYKDQITSYFSDEWNTSCIKYANSPYVIDITSDIIIEKTIVYCDEDNDDIWSKEEDIIEYVLLYSNE